MSAYRTDTPARLDGRAAGIVLARAVRLLLRNWAGAFLAAPLLLATPLAPGLAAGAGALAAPVWIAVGAAALPGVAALVLLPALVSLHGGADGDPPAGAGALWRGIGASARRMPGLLALPVVFVLGVGALAALLPDPAGPAAAQGATPPDPPEGGGAVAQLVLWASAVLALHFLLLASAVWFQALRDRVGGDAPAPARSRSGALRALGDAGRRIDRALPPVAAGLLLTMATGGLAIPFLGFIALAALGLPVAAAVPIVGVLVLPLASLPGLVFFQALLALPDPAP